MKKIVGVALLALAACAADTGEDEGTPEKQAPAERVAPPGKTEPAVVGQTRTSWLPRWEVYELPHTRGTDAPALAVPKDGRGVPLILWAGWYRKYGDAYFQTMLHSGYLSLLDLEIIGAGLEKPSPWKDPVPEGAVDPFEDRVAIPESLKPGDNRIAVEPEDGPVSDPGDGEGAHGTAGAPLLRAPPRGGGGSGGAHPSNNRGGVLPSFDPTAGPAKLHEALTGWLTADVVRAFVGDRDTCDDACSGGKHVPASDELACKLVPALRAIPETVVPCASIEAARERVGIATTWCHAQCEALWWRVK